MGGSGGPDAPTTPVAPDHSRRVQVAKELGALLLQQQLRLLDALLLGRQLALELPDDVVLLRDRLHANTSTQDCGDAGVLQSQGREAHRAHALVQLLNLLRLRQRTTRSNGAHGKVSERPEDCVAARTHLFPLEVAQLPLQSGRRRLLRRHPALPLVLRTATTWANR